MNDWMPLQIRIATYDEMADPAFGQAWAIAYCDEIAVNKTPWSDGLYAVTHRPTGCAILNGIALDMALACYREILVRLDWLTELRALEARDIPFTVHAELKALAERYYQIEEAANSESAVSA